MGSFWPWGRTMVALSWTPSRRVIFAHHCMSISGGAGGGVWAIRGTGDRTSARRKTRLRKLVCMVLLGRISVVQFIRLGVFRKITLLRPCIEHFLEAAKDLCAFTPGQAGAQQCCARIWTST